MRGASVGALAAATICTALAAPAGAQTAAQTRRFAAAQKLYDTGAYSAALAEFQALVAETRSPNAAVYAARCLRELGKLPEAYDAMAAALRDATAKANTEPKYVSTRDVAAADLALLEPRVGKLVIAVANPPPGLAVTVGDVPRPSEKLGQPLAAPIGEVVVRLQAPGHTPVERRITLRGGETSTLAVTMEEPAETPSHVATPPVVEAPARGLGGTRIGGIVVLGVGAVGMVTFAAAGTTSNSRYASLQKVCPGASCPADLGAQVSSGRTLDIVANVGLGVGIAGLVGGALMVALGGPPRAAPDAARLAPWVTAQGGGLGVRGGF